MRYGRICTTGRTQTKNHDWAALAKWFADKQVAEKVMQGYHEVSRGAAPVDRKQLAELRKLLGQSDAAAVWQGIDLLRALDDPALWATLAEGASVDAEGEVHTPSGSEIHKRVRAGLRASVAVWVLSASGRLAYTRRLLLPGYAFADYTFTKALPRLKVLDLNSSPLITDLAGLQGLAGLRNLPARCEIFGR